jgi:carbamoyl-phosphate synthase small subunit
MKIILESGDILNGQAFGAKPDKDVIGEVVFNTSMAGYQEVFSDPSYCDQIVTMTYPLIGNYGINNDDYESLTPSLKGIIVKEACKNPSHWKNQKSLEQFLIQHNVVGVHSVDTRKLTKLIRERGVMKGLLTSDDVTYEDVKDQLQKDLPTDQIPRVSSKTHSHFPNHGGERIVMIDFGYKKNILSSLLKRGFDVIVVPWNTTVPEIDNYAPDGIMLSNGPGDPKDIKEVLPTIKALQEKYPLFAICMGHQIFALANGANTQKMKFGHRGSNHPVKDLIKDKVYITSQNHGYAVTHDSLSDTELILTQINLNDESIEGLKHKRLPAFSVQYHPEANPGPTDTHFLFDEFLQMIKGFKNA